jgi:hypothetical protein
VEVEAEVEVGVVAGAAEEAVVDVEVEGRTNEFG